MADGATPGASHAQTLQQAATLEQLAETTTQQSQAMMQNAHALMANPTTHAAGVAMEAQANAVEAQAAAMHAEASDLRARVAGAKAAQAQMMQGDQQQAQTVATQMSADSSGDLARRWRAASKAAKAKRAAGEASETAAPGGGGGVPAARLTDIHTCPAHGGGPIITGAATVLINNKPAARISDKAKCAEAIDVITKGCPTILIEGMPPAGLGDECAHGGVIVTGSPNVLVCECTQCGCMKAAKQAGRPFVQQAGPTRGDMAQDPMQATDPTQATDPMQAADPMQAVDFQQADAAVAQMQTDSRLPPADTSDPDSFHQMWGSILDWWAAMREE